MIEAGGGAAAAPSTPPWTRLAIHGLLTCPPDHMRLTCGETTEWPVVCQCWLSPPKGLREPVHERPSGGSRATKADHNQHRCANRATGITHVSRVVDSGTGWRECTGQCTPDTWFSDSLRHLDAAQRDGYGGPFGACPRPSQNTPP